MASLTIDRNNVDALIDDVAGHLNAQHGRLIDVTIWLLANPHEWQGEGVWTPAHYLAWRAGVSPAMASNLVAIAERADGFPEAIDTVRRGEMSIDQLLPIIRHVPAWADAQVTSLAHKLTVSQVRRLVRETQWAWTPGTAASDDSAGHRPAHSLGDEESTDTTESDQPADDPGDEPDLNRVNYGFGDNGRWYLHAHLDADLGAQIHESLDEARDALFRERNHRNSSSHGDHNDHDGPDHPDGSDEPSTPTAPRVAQPALRPNDPNVIVPVSDAEALADLAFRSMDGIESTDRRDRCRVNLFLDLNGNCTTTEHMALPDSLRDLLTCDGRIDPVFVDGASPISIGRSSRVIPDRLRRIVLHRDHGCCQVPGCTITRSLDLHHIIHWSRGGPTDSSNLVTVCSRHHRMHHKKRLGITGNANEASSLEFTDHRGMPIRASGADPTAPTGPPPPIHGRYEHPVGERLDTRWVTFVDPAIPMHLRHHHPGIAG